MSIYASTVSFDAQMHDDHCTRWVPLAPSQPDTGHMMISGENRWTYDKHQPCTCKAGPIAYRRSHILPSDDDERAGCFDLAEIPGFISRGDRILCDEATCDKPATDCCDQVWPWLRASVNSETVILDRAQVLRAYHYLGDWLMRSPDCRFRYAVRDRVIAKICDHQHVGTITDRELSIKDGGPVYCVHFDQPLPATPTGPLPYRMCREDELTPEPDPTAIEEPDSAP